MNNIYIVEFTHQPGEAGKMFARLDVMRRWPGVVEVTHPQRQQPYHSNRLRFEIKLANAFGRQHVERLLIALKGGILLSPLPDRGAA